MPIAYHRPNTFLVKLAKHTAFMLSRLYLAYSQGLVTRSVRFRLQGKKKNIVVPRTVLIIACLQCERRFEEFIAGFIVVWVRINGVARNELQLPRTAHQTSLFPTQ